MVVESADAHSDCGHYCDRDNYSTKKISKTIEWYPRQPITYVILFNVVRHKFIDIIYKPDI